MVAFFRDDLSRRKQRKVWHSELQSQEQIFGEARRVLNFDNIKSVKSKLILDNFKLSAESCISEY